MTHAKTIMGMLIGLGCLNTCCSSRQVNTPQPIRLLTVEAISEDNTKATVICRFEESFDEAKLRRVLTTELTSRERVSELVQIAIRFRDGNENTWLLNLRSLAVPTNRRWYDAGQELVADTTVSLHGTSAKGRYDAKEEFIADVVKYLRDYVDDTPGTYP